MAENPPVEEITGTQRLIKTLKTRYDAGEHEIRLSRESLQLLTGLPAYDEATSRLYFFPRGEGAGDFIPSAVDTTPFVKLLRV